MFQNFSEAKYLTLGVGAINALFTMVAVSTCTGFITSQELTNRPSKGGIPISVFLPSGFGFDLSEDLPHERQHITTPALVDL